MAPTSSGPAERTQLVIDSFPALQAGTQRFTLGVPRSFQVSPDGSRAAFLRSRSGAAWGEEGRVRRGTSDEGRRCQ